MSNFRFFSHHLLVLRGWRPSISFLLRQHLLPSRVSSGTSVIVAPTLDSIGRNVPSITTTAAYLIFSDGDLCLTMEKDHHTAIIRPWTDFVVATKYDAAAENSPRSANANSHAGLLNLQLAVMDHLDDMTEDSVHRKKIATNLWSDSLRPKPRRSCREPQSPTQDNVVKWMSTFSIVNELTHFATVMARLLRFLSSPQITYLES